MMQCRTSPDIVDLARSVYIRDDIQLARVGSRTISATDEHDLIRQLGRVLYEVWHLGWEKRPDVNPYRRDRPFERDLSDAIGPIDNRMHSVLHTSNSETGDALVDMQGVRVWVPRSDILTPGNPAAGDIIEFRSSAIRPAVSPGFLYLDRTSLDITFEATERIYINARSADHAPHLWRDVVNVLEGTSKAYCAKVLSLRELYPRTDSIVVYVDADSADTVDAIIDSTAGHPGISDSVSYFVTRLASGIGSAGEPVDQRTGMTGMSFGEHRAAVIARALVQSVSTGDRLERILGEQLSAARVRPDRLSENC